MLRHKKKGHIAAALAVVAVAAYTLLVLPNSSSAVATSSVGQLAVAVKPNASQSAYDEVRLTFDSYLGGVGQFDLSGWSFGNGVGDEYTFDQGTVLNTGEAVVACSVDSNLAGCTNQLWSGDIWNNANGTVVLKDAAGVTMFTLNYSGVAVDDIEREIYTVSALVYDENDKIELCHTADATAFKLSKANAAHIIDEKGGHKNDVGDIVPPFYYHFKSGYGYFAGQNWDDVTEAFLAAGCQ